MKRSSLHMMVCVVALSSVLSACGSSDSSDETELVVDDTPVVETPAQSLVINEIVASPEGDGTDWIELYAITDIADLSIYTIVDDNASHTPQALPEIALAAGDYLIVQAIDDADTPPSDAYYVTFKLGGDDAVYLYESDTLVHELDWQDGEAEEGYSYGLYTDGSDNPQTLTPTPGEANQEATDVVVADTIIENNAVLRINEIVAKDASDGEDWIELYASGNEAVFLGDYSISDENEERVPLPDVTIAAGEFYRVYATNDDIEGEWSVAFKLGSSDTLSLFLADDLIDQLSWDKGEALIGFSYGRYPDGSDNTKTLTPTALAQNSLATRGPLLINELVASQDDDSTDWFELYNNGNEAILLSDYQIIDSSDDIDPITLPELTLQPGEYKVILATDDAQSTDYVPFKLGKEEELSLLKNDETVDYVEWQESDVSAGYSYGAKTDGSWMQTTLALTQGETNQVPDIYAHDEVESIYFEIEEEQWQDLLDNALDEEYHLSSVTFKGVTLDEVAIRTKGNSSLNSVYQMGSERFSFNIDVNEYVDDQKLLGMKKFVLNNMFNDPSYMREFIAYELLDEMGVATPQHSYVNVYVNGELKGLYLLVEFVNKDFLRQHFENPQGDLYKPDGTGSDLQYINDEFASYSDVELKTNEESSDNGAFLDFVYELAFGDAASVIDEDSVMRYLAVSVALSNLDSYHGSLAHNYYIYEQDNVFSLLPWDLNESFGTFSQGCNGVDIRGLYIDEPTSGALAERPLIAKVLENSDNLTRYHAYLSQLIEGALSDDSFAARVTSIDTLISSHVENDPSAFYSFAQYKLNQTSTVSRFYGLTDFMTYRINNMQQQLDGDIASSGSGNGYCNR